LSVITVVAKIFINLCLDAPPRESATATSSGSLSSKSEDDEEILHTERGDGRDDEPKSASSASLANFEELNSPPNTSSAIVAVHPEWLSDSLHQQLFLQLQDVLGQLPADLESLKGIVIFPILVSCLCHSYWS
jgi:hypothetical protein